MDPDRVCDLHVHQEYWHTALPETSIGNLYQSADPFGHTQVDYSLRLLGGGALCRRRAQIPVPQRASHNPQPFDPIPGWKCSSETRKIRFYLQRCAGGHGSQLQLSTSWRKWTVPVKLPVEINIDFRPRLFSTIPGLSWQRYSTIPGGTGFQTLLA